MADQSAAKAPTVQQSIDRQIARYPGAGTFEFGDTPALSKELIDLVRQGRKTATCGALRDIEAGEELFPEVGRHDIVLNHEGLPELVLQTVWVAVMRFCDVDWSFAQDEGEDEDLEGWRRGHQDFFARTGGFEPDMKVVCQRFRLVEDLAPR